MRVCATPGCPELTADTYCPAHIPAPRPEERGSATSRGYGSRWRAYSKAFLVRNPFCVPCQVRGTRSPATITDHITPVTGPADPKFWIPSNHQPICRSCHAAKTHIEGRTQQDTPTRRLAWA